MITIKRDVEAYDKNTMVSSIPIGTTFTGKISAYEGLFLRTYEHLVKLDEPKHTWSIDTMLHIKGYRDVDITIIVENRNANNNS